MPVFFRNPILLILQATLLSLVMALSGAAQAETGQRWALVMGVAEYQSELIPSLDNTVNDARTMAAALNDMGFRVYLLENATKADLAATITRIGRDMPGAELGFFFFAGHGLQPEA